MRPLLLPTLALALLLLSQCKKHDPDPVDQLPPATQTGAGTFGCLLNGQPWTPAGYAGRPNFITTYDAGYAGGALQVKCYRYTSSSTVQSIIFGGANIKQTGTYLSSTTGPISLTYFDTSLNSPCSIVNSTDAGVYCAGTLTLTRFDRQAGIIAGTFTFTLYKPGCDTIKVTQGRFDYTL